MIKKLRLNSYGKFKMKDYTFSPVTAFIGDNESGKTTIFDALFNSLCSPSGSTTDGKRLKARYGDERSVSIEFEDDELSLDKSSPFLNHFSVHPFPTIQEIV